jgi:hypothetical protein|tara:strand:+ start:1396 stop:1623 length:228 start_codon:yes stop_codon:yes gene_type:complete
MYKNKLEEDLKRQLNLSEGLAFAIVKFLMKGKVKRALKKMNKDPEMKAAIEGMNYHANEVKRLAKEMDDEYGFNL